MTTAKSVLKLSPRWSRLNQELRDQIAEYIENGKRPTSAFLLNLIKNDIKEAFRSAGTDERKKFGEYVQLFFSFAPHHCWGGAAELEIWVKRGGLFGSDQVDE